MRQLLTTGHFWADLRYVAAEPRSAYVAERGSAVTFPTKIKNVQ
jgi:hypothetical protein